MLVYARLVLSLMLISACFQVIGGVLVLSQSVITGAIMILIGGLFAYLAYSNYTDAAECANRAFLEAYGRQ